MITTPTPRLNIAQAGELLGQLIRPNGRAFTGRGIRNWCKFRRLPHLKLGRSISFDPDELRQWVESQKSHRQPQPLKF